MMCRKCELLNELFKGIKDSTNRDYWVMTELFVYLHDGKDYCKGEDKTATTLLNLKLTKKGIYPEARGKRPEGAEVEQPPVYREPCCVNVCTCNKAKTSPSNCFSCRDYNDGKDIYIRPIKRGEVFL
mgnify:FL=1